MFFAVWPALPFCQELGAVAARMLERVEGRRLAADDWHVTVCFIGSVNDAILAALQASAAALSASSFTLSFDRIEYWPEARVVAATASQAPAPAVALSAALREMARSLGLAPDEKPWRPHVTLMRGVNPLAWQMNQSRTDASLQPEIPLVSEALYLAESRPAARVSGSAPASPQDSAARAPSYARLASWPLQR